MRYVVTCKSTIGHSCEPQETSMDFLSNVFHCLRISMLNYFKIKQSNVPKENKRKEQLNHGQMKDSLLLKGISIFSTQNEH